MTTQITPITVDVKEACRVLGLGKTCVYELLNAGVFQSFYVGKRKLIIYSSMQRWAETQAALSQQKVR